jgi:hypothetical protein
MKRQTVSQLQRGSVVAVALALVLGSAWLAHAGQRPDQSASIDASKRELVAATGAITTDEKIACPKTRKKLWTERDGWIVRRVQVCN